jgi:hypothetical protein
VRARYLSSEVEIEEDLEGIHEILEFFMLICPYSKRPFN